jgi:hypothetical protein
MESVIRYFLDKSMIAHIEINLPLAMLYVFQPVLKQVEKYIHDEKSYSVQHY